MRLHKRLAGSLVFLLRARHPDCIARTYMKPTLIVLAFISLAGSAIIFARIVPARAFSIHGAEPIGAGSCEDRYNSSLKNAKAALTAGDRAATLAHALRVTYTSCL